MDEPRASRPWMPGYGTLPEHEGTGLLPWSWALEQLKTSHNYWLVTADAGGGPHLMPVWAVWDDGILWFSSSRGSRKVRNLRADPRCVLSTEDANNPMIMRGTAELVTDAAELQRILDLENAKYGTDYGMELFDPEVNCVFRFTPTWAFGLLQDDFAGSPTRWRLNTANKADGGTGRSYVT